MSNSNNFGKQSFTMQSREKPDPKNRNQEKPDPKNRNQEKPDLNGRYSPDKFRDFNQKIIIKKQKFNPNKYY